MNKLICTPEGKFIYGLESAKREFLFLDLIKLIRDFNQSIGYKSDDESTLLTIAELKKTINTISKNHNYVRLTSHDCCRLAALLFDKNKLDHREFLAVLHKDKVITHSQSFILVTVENREFLADIYTGEICAVQTQNLGEIAYCIAYKYLCGEMRRTLNSQDLSSVLTKKDMNEITSSSVLGILGENTSAKIYNYVANDPTIDGLAVDKFIKSVMKSKAVHVQRPTKFILEQLVN